MSICSCNARSCSSSSVISSSKFNIAIISKLGCPRKGHFAIFPTHSQATASRSYLAGISGTVLYGHYVKISFEGSPTSCGNFIWTIILDFRRRLKTRSEATTRYWVQFSVTRFLIWRTPYSKCSWI